MGKFPDILKKAEVTPDYKKDDLNDKQNYSPVTTLSSLKNLSGPMTPGEPCPTHSPSLHTHTQTHTHTHTHKRRKKERVSNQKLWKGSHQDQNVTASHSGASRIQKLFFSANDDGRQYFSLSPSTFKSISPVLLIYSQINTYMSDKFSKYLTVFRGYHNMQHALLNMIENWKVIQIKEIKKKVYFWTCLMLSAL